MISSHLFGSRPMITGRTMARMECAAKTGRGPTTNRARCTPSTIFWRTSAASYGPMPRTAERSSRAAKACRSRRHGAEGSLSSGFAAFPMGPRVWTTHSGSPLAVASRNIADLPLRCPKTARARTASSWSAIVSAGRTTTPTTPSTITTRSSGRQIPHGSWRGVRSSSPRAIRTASCRRRCAIQAASSSSRS